jgi:hypothetical protein
MPRFRISAFSGIDSCAVTPSSFYPLSHVAGELERTVCAFSDLPHALPFCGPLVCPMDEAVMGYPWALLPNRTGSVKGIRGFAPASVHQWPPPGTPLWRNTTTNVTMTAIDATGRTAECRWKLYVPPLVEIGFASFSIRNGTYNETLRFSGLALLSGQIFKLTGRARDKVRGGGSSVGAVIRDTSNKQTGRPLSIPENKDRGAVAVPKVKVQFSNLNVSDVQLDVQLDVHVSWNDQPNQLTFVAYGQRNDVFEYRYI